MAPGAPALGCRPPVLRYSYDGIEHLRRRLSADDDAWGRHFLRHAIDPLELVYEADVQPDPGGAVTRVLNHIGVDRPTAWEPEARTVRQSDGLSDEWYTAYHRQANERVPH